MAQYKIAPSSSTSTEDFLRVEADNYRIDSMGLSFFRDTTLVASFPTYNWFVRIDALKTDAESAE